MVEGVPLFVTVTVNCAPICPCVKLPTSLLEIVRSGAGMAGGSNPVA